MPDSSFRIIFMGTPDFAVPALKSLLAGKDRVAAVVTRPNRPRGRGRKLTPPPVKIVAQEAGIPVLQPEKIRRPDFTGRLRELSPDLFVVAAYGRILPGPLIHLPPLGTINIHASLLPAYRGAAPIQWALIRGEAETGVTIMQMDEGLDTGDILLQARQPVDPEDTAGTLAEKLAVLGGRTLLTALDRLREGTLEPAPQDHQRATPAPPLKKEDGLLDWSRPAGELGRLIRGLDPWPAGFTFLAGERFRFFAPRVIPGPAAGEPGTLERADEEGLLIAAGSDRLLIREIQPAGGRRLPVGDYLRGHPLTAGVRFGR